MIQELASDPFKHITEQASHLLAKTEHLKNDLEETEKVVNSKIPKYLHRGENLRLAELRMQRRTSEAQKMKEICYKRDELESEVRKLKKQLGGQTPSKHEIVASREDLQRLHCEYQRLYRLAHEVRAGLMRPEGFPEYEGKTSKNPMRMHTINTSCIVECCQPWLVPKFLN